MVVCRGAFGLVQAEPVTASSLIRADALQIAKAAELDVSATVNWKSPTLGRFKCNIDAFFVEWMLVDLLVSGEVHWKL
ncbi:hypothetical protein L195_g026375 [Trifolium pratense]|uniref:Uncharacterized protein n=1 Tax=Trifolium pratense TaxID=57577 RepID=A0A2K3NJ22_TRIPR|nr:hypothetical protein L195_g026375 [Trifolium pratense]